MRKRLHPRQRNTIRSSPFHYRLSISEIQRKTARLIITEAKMFPTATAIVVFHVVKGDCQEHLNRSLFEFAL